MVEKRDPLVEWAWIEIDRSKVAPTSFVSGSELLAKWKADDAYGHNIMPEIEAAHLGAIPRAAFKRASLVRKENDEFTNSLSKSRGSPDFLGPWEYA